MREAGWVTPRGGPPQRGMAGSSSRASGISHLASRLLPGSRLPPRLLVQEQNHRPDLPLGEEALPHRHRRAPRRALTGEAGPALGDAPKHEALGELRDRAVVLEVRGERVEAGREVSLAVEVIAMTRETVPVVDVLALREIRGEGVGVPPQRVLESRQRDRLAPKRDLGGLP